MNRIWVLSSLLLAAPVQEEPRPTPKRPETPFRVFVLAEPASDEPEAVERVLEAEQECHKQLKRRKSWFQSVSDRAQAEIVVTIKSSLLQEWMVTEPSPMSDTPINVAREHHYVFADVTVLGLRMDMKGGHQRSVKGAASELMKAVEEYCKQNYWEILKRRKKEADRANHRVSLL